MTKTLDLKQKCAVVTGGGHGIGRALVERLAAEGARVVVADLNGDRAAKIAARVGGLALTVDVGDPAAVKELALEAEKAFGPVTVFCSNAGIGDLGDGLVSTPGEVDSIVRVNLLAHIWAAEAVVPSMVECGEGYIVQTISSAALITGPSGMGYTVTKHGALGFAEWLALNYSHLGLRVICLCPNAVNTGMLGRNEDNEAASVLRTDAVTTNIGDIVEPETCADMTLEAMAAGRFLVLPHARVGDSFLRKAQDYDRWLEGTNRRLRRMRGEIMVAPYEASRD
jgi:NAD(P)-dependent dehydrogenase (short-subunit alcohol dehydrogenase family)